MNKAKRLDALVESAVKDFAIFLFIITVVLFGLPPPIDYLEFVAILLTSFTFYKMTTSLSPTSRIRKEVTTEGSQVLKIKSART